MPRSHESAVPRPLLVLLFALLLANAGLSAWGNVRLYRTCGNPGFLPTGKGNVVTVGQVRSPGPAGDLRVGDEILALEGHGVRGQEDVWSFFLHRPPGPYHIAIRRDGRPLNLGLAAPPYEWGWSVSLGLSRVAVHLLFALSGLAVFLLRPEGKSGLLLSLAFILFVPGDTLSLAPELIGPFARALMVLSDTVSFLFWPVLLHFLLVFPEPSPVVRRWPWIERVLYLPTLAIMLVALPISVLVFVDRDLMWGALRSAGWFSWFAGALWIPSTLFGLAVLVTSYRQATVVSRRKLRVAVIGTLAGLLPLLALLVTNALLDTRQMPLWTIRSLAFAATLALPLVPLSFAYAIFRHQVIPLRMILRRGLRYVLVSRGVVVFEAALVAGFVAFALTGWRGRLVDAISPRADIVVALAVGGLGMLALHRINRRLRSAIDRQFFREAFDARRMLTTLSEAVREVPSAEALVDLVAGRVRDALHPEAVRIYLREVGDRTFRLAYPKGAFEDEAATAALVARLSGVDQSVAYAGDEPGLSGIVLALAMRGKRDLMGVLALGPRMGDLPYTREDRELLLSVASQAGLALENAGLIHQVAAQERVAHELTIAAEVQRRLVPGSSSRLPRSGPGRPLRARGRRGGRLLRFPGAGRRPHRGGGGRRRGQGPARGPAHVDGPGFPAEPDGGGRSRPARHLRRDEPTALPLDGPERVRHLLLWRVRGGPPAVALRERGPQSASRGPRFSPAGRSRREKRAWPRRPEGRSRWPRSPRPSWPRRGDCPPRGSCWERWPRAPTSRRS